MHIGAIICEYNPFHNGHFHQIETLKAQKGGAVIALMSGNFVQRGEPGFFSKFTRAKAALSGGADLVLELPLQYSLQSAEGFAKGAVDILNNLNCVNTLCFGASCTDLTALQQIASLLNRAATIQQIKQLKKQGLSYPAGLKQIITQELGEEKADIVDESNNILAVEYLKALDSLNSPISPLPIARKGVLHSEESNGKFASATYLRKLLQKKSNSWEKFVPQNILPLYKEALGNGEFIDQEKYNTAILSYLKRLNSDCFSLCPDVTGGYENKLEECVNKAVSYNELIERLIDKTHTRAGVKRILTNAFLNITTKGNSNLNNDTAFNFVRVLGFNKTGETVLNKMKSSSQIQFSAKVLDCARDEYIDLLDTSTNLYNFCLENPKESKEEFTTQVIKIS